MQSAREAARRAQCTSNLKNIVLACHNYVDVNKAWPARQSGTGDVNNADGLGQQRLRISGFVSICPFIEQQAIYDQIQQINNAPWSGNSPWKQVIDVYTCPSDAGDNPPKGSKRGLRSYAMCAGDNYESSVVDGEKQDDNLANQRRPIRNRGIFGRLDFTSMAEIQDGTSNTIALAERSRPSNIRGRGMVAVDASADPTSYVPLTCRTYWQGNQYSPAAAIFTQDTSPGYRWGDGAAFFSAVTTILPPNSAVCLIGDPAWQNGGGHYAYGIWTATSDHPGGVNVAMADGSVHFIRETIDTGNLSVVAPNRANTSGASPYGVWGALGTKRGGETVSGSDL
ncbi:MAG: DUF1559 domain-containing protein [Planctomycetota bacterium]|nr:MAG: DUF1559 domain-containing protein [Planctomycetota bacterium]